jgi:hypothetical protein
MANKKQRAWFIDKLSKLGLVEKGTNVVTKDGYTSDWKSITEVKDLRIYAISRDSDLTANNMTATWSQIPSQFHDAIINKAICYGYKDPRHIDLELSSYFDGEFFKGVKRAKKFARSNYQAVGFVRQQDF